MDVDAESLNGLDGTQPVHPLSGDPLVGDFQDDRPELEMQDIDAYKRFLMGLPASAWEAFPEDRQYLVTIAALYRGYGTRPWEVAQLWERLTGRKEAVTTFTLLTAIHCTLTILWLEEEANTLYPNAPPDAGVLYVLCRTLSGPPVAEPKEVVAPVEPAVEPQVAHWVDRPAVPLPEHLQAAAKASYSLQEMVRRKKVLGVYPEFEGIPRAAQSNAPNRHHQDPERRGWEQQARDVQRLLASLDLGLRQPDSITPTPMECLTTAYGLCDALVKDIERVRKIAIDPRLEVGNPDAPKLLTKDDLAVLKDSKVWQQNLNSRVARYRPYRTQNYQSRYPQGKGKGTSYQSSKGASYQSSKGSSKGKSKGKGKGTFSFDRQDGK